MRAETPKKSQAYSLLYPGPTGLTWFSSQRSRFKALGLYALLAEWSEEQATVTVTTGFDKRSYPQLLNYLGGFLYLAARDSGLANLEALVAVLGGLQAWEGDGALGASHLQGVLTGFGHPVVYINSRHKLYHHFQELGVDIPERFAALMADDAVSGDLDAFIRLRTELENRDPRYPLVREGHLENVLSGFGHQVVYIASSYKLYQHYQGLGLDIPERFAALLADDAVSGALDAFIRLLAELKEKDPKFALAQETHLQSVLAGFGHPVGYINSHYKLYQHYQGFGLDILERYAALLTDDTVSGRLDAFICLLAELKEMDSKYSLVKGRHLYGVLTGFGRSVPSVRAVTHL